MRRGLVIALVIVALGNVVAAFAYREWWLLAVTAGLVAVVADQWRRDRTSEEGARLPGASR